MTTSGVYTLSVNRDQIIRMAMLNIEKLDEVETPTPQEITDCSLMLNMQVKQWMGKADFAPGLKTWTRRHGHLFLSGLTGQYTLSPTASGWTNNYVQTTTTATVAAGVSIIPVSSVVGMTAGDHFGIVLDGDSYIYWTTIQSILALNVTITGAIPTGTQASFGAGIFNYTTAAQQPDVIETAFLRDFTFNDTPLRLMTLQEYDNLPNKAATLTYVSDPTAVYHEWQLGGSYLFTDVAGSADLTKHIAMTYMEETQVFTNPLDTPEYPYEWLLPLALGLSKLISPMYGAVWTPLMESNFTTALAIAQHKDPNDKSVAYFQCGEDY
jgi:hypothetical protein